MRSIQLLVVPLAIAICVSTTFGQETKTKSDTKDVAKPGRMLHGIWAGDADKTAKEIEKEDLDLDKSAIERMLERVNQIEINFTDGEFDAQIGDQEMYGEWKVTKVKNMVKTQILTVHFTPDDDVEGEEKDFEIQFMGKTHMKMVDLTQEGPPIVMKRKVKEKKDKAQENEKDKAIAEEKGEAKEEKKDKAKENQDKS